LNCQGTNATCYGVDDGSVCINTTGLGSNYSILWTQAGVPISTDECISDLAIGTYCVIVSTSSGGHGTCCYTVTGLSSIQFDVSVNPPATCGGLGAFNFNAGGGTPPYSGVLSPCTINPAYCTFNNLVMVSTLDHYPKGNYQITVTDAIGCSVTVPVEMPEASFYIDCAGTNISCNGSADGSVCVTPACGIGPYTYQWFLNGVFFPGPQTSCRTGLSPGTYSIVVIDGNNDTAICYYTIPDPQVKINGSTAVCKNAGAIQFAGSPVGGTFLGSYISSSGLFNLVAAPEGMHTFSYRYVSATGCTTTVSKNVFVEICSSCGLCFTDGPELVRNGRFSNGTDFVASELSRNLDLCIHENAYVVTTNSDDVCQRFWASYGHAPSPDNNFMLINGRRNSTKKAWLQSIPVKKGSLYRFSIWTKMGLQEKHSIGGNVGSFGVTKQVNVDNDHPNLQMYMGGDMIKFIHGNSILPIGRGSAATEWTNFEAFWTATTDGNITASIMQITNSGGYNYIYGLDDISIVECEPNITLNLGNDRTVCPGYGTTITSTVFSKNGIHSYLWQPGGQTTFSISASPSTTTSYTCTVEDNFGCTDTKIIKVEVKEIGFNIGNINCSAGKTGSIEVESCTGIPPFSYLWNTGDTTAVVNGLGAGMYSVTVIDSVGTIFIDSARIYEPDPITVQHEKGDACGIENDGYILLETSGGTGPLSYLWSNGSTDLTLSGVTAGNYSVSIMDSLGCDYTDSDTVYYVASVRCGKYCCENSVPSIPILEEYFTPIQPLSLPFIVDNDLVQRTGCDAGTYEVVKKAWDKCASLPFDVTDCTTGDGYFLMVHGSNTLTNMKVYKKVVHFDAGKTYLITASFFSNMDESNLDTNVSFVLNNITYVGAVDTVRHSVNRTWQEAGFCYIPDITGDIEFAIIQGNKGRVYGIDNIKIFTCDSIPLAPIAETPLTDTVCFGGILPSYNLGVISAYPPVSVVWQDSTYTGDSLTDIPPGWYPFALIDSLGFLTVDSLHVVELPPVLVSATAGLIYCHGGSTNVTVTASGGSGTYTGTGSYSAFAGSQIYIVTDTKGCNSSDTILISEPPPLPLAITLGPISLCWDGLNPSTVYSLGVDTTGAGPGATVVWNDIFFTNTDSLDIYASDYGFGSLTFIATLTNGYGCQTADSVDVIIGTCTGGSTLNLNLFLEGFYVGGGMMWTTLYDLSYSFDSTVTDTISVDLWSTAAAAANIAPEYSQKALLHSDGTASLDFLSTAAGNYYIAVRHRNSMETWSAFPVIFNSSIVNYSFSNSLTQAYGNNMNDLGDGNFTIYSGDVNQDGFIDFSDYTELSINIELFQFGYFTCDLTGDGFVESSDLSIIENNIGKLVIRP